MKNNINIATFKIDYEGTGRQSQTLEVITNNDTGRYSVSVLGARGRVRSFRHDFDDVLEKGWIYDALINNTSFRWLLATIGVNIYSYAGKRFYYVGATV